MSVTLRAITESEGTPPRALALADALDIPAQPGVAGSVREMLRVGSVPRFRPERWNDDVIVQINNNCYNYASDVRNNTYAQPGVGGGLSDVSLDCPGETAGAIADGLISTGSQPSLAGVEFGHVVALVIAPARDFHWYRRDRDGTWSHKPGATEATNLDDDDKVITDPRVADRGLYTEFCGFFCVPRGAIAIDGFRSTVRAATTAAPADDVTVVRLLVFSGRPDPEWVLEGGEEPALVAKLATARRGTRLAAAPSRRSSRLGYRGFVIDRPGRVPGTRDVTTVRAGVVTDVRLTGAERRPDAGGLEDELLAQARRRGFGDLLLQ